MTYECGRKRQEIKLLKEGGANEDDLIAARSRYRGTSAEYARFSKAMDLPQQRERVTVDGLGNIGQGKYTKTDNVKNKSVDNGGKSGIIKSGARYGAYNDKNDPNNKKREVSAERYYEEIRNRDRNAEIEAISQNTGFSKDDVDAIFSHVFEQEHPFEDGTTHRFVPDYYMQQSFMRIREGKNIQKHDITLLNHELAEYKLMSANPNMVYEEAHAIVEKQYNYAKELLEYLKEKSKKGG